MIEDAIRAIDLDGAASFFSTRASSRDRYPGPRCASTSSPRFRTPSAGSPSRSRSRPCSAPSSSCASSTTATRRRCARGRSTTRPTAAARAWCCASTSSPPRSRPRTATSRPARVIALTPQGRQLDQALVEELAAEPALAVLSSRFEGFDARIVDHLCTDAVSIGPYVLSGGELPAMVLVDAIARGCRARSPRAPARTRASATRSTAGSSTRTTRVRRSSAAGRCPTCCSRATTRGSTAGGASRAGSGAPRERRRRPAPRVPSSRRRARRRPRRPGRRADARRLGPRRRPGRGEADSGWGSTAGPSGPTASRRSARPSRSRPPRDRPPPPPPRLDRHSRNPVDRLTRRPAERAPRHDRLGRHDRRRGRDRAARQGVRRQPVPDPVVVDGADAPLRPAGDRLRGALLRPGAREPVPLPPPRPASRRDHRLQDAPAAEVKCGAGGTFVKRLIGLPGESVELRLRNGDGLRLHQRRSRCRSRTSRTARRAAAQAFGPVKVSRGTTS